MLLTQNERDKVFAGISGGSAVWGEYSEDCGVYYLQAQVHIRDGVSVVCSAADASLDAAIEKLQDYINESQNYRELEIIKRKLQGKH